MTDMIRFGNKQYQQEFDEYLQHTTTGKYARDLATKAWEGSKYTFLNCLPTAGWLPVSWQKTLRDNHRRWFAQVDYDISTIAAPLSMGLLAFFVGRELEGFDVGSIQDVSKGWYTVKEYVSYFQQFMGFNGIPKEVTQAVSYFLIADSIARVSSGLVGRPLGFLPLEGLAFLVEERSKKSVQSRELKEDLAKERLERDQLRAFTNEERMEIEKQLSSLEWKLLDDPQNTQVINERDDLLAKMGVLS